jgi:hypothetical protein
VFIIAKIRKERVEWPYKQPGAKGTADELGSMAISPTPQA